MVNRIAYWYILVHVVGGPHGSQDEPPPHAHAPAKHRNSIPTLCPTPTALHALTSHSPLAFCQHNLPCTTCPHALSSHHNREVDTTRRMASHGYHGFTWLPRRHGYRTTRSDTRRQCCAQRLVSRLRCGLEMASLQRERVSSFPGRLAATQAKTAALHQVLHQLASVLHLRARRSQEKSQWTKLEIERWVRRFQRSVAR